MAKLCDLPSCFMEAFLKANPNSLVDSNGYLRSEYEAELARRKQPVAESNSVPDPRTYRPQFECTGEAALPAFETAEAQLGIGDIKQLGDEGYLTQEQMEAILTSPLIVTTTPAPPIAEGAQRLRIVDDVRPEVMAHAEASMAQNGDLLALLAKDESIQVPVSASVETPETTEIAPDVTVQDLGVNESPVPEAEPEVKEDLAADTVYISEHELPEPESEPQA